jgi:hypothetical protein
MMSGSHLLIFVLNSNGPFLKRGRDISIPGNIAVSTAAVQGL